jgi:hypothetical protein
MVAILPMSAITPKESVPSQLRGLRLLMGKDNKPISGRAFAAEVGIAAGTLRAVEAGARSLSKKDLDRIKNQLGAVWNPNKKFWGRLTNPSIRWTKAFYEAFRAAVFQDPNQRELDAETVSYQINEIISSIPAENYLSAVVQLQDVLEEFAGRFPLPKRVRHMIANLAPVVVAIPDSANEGALAVVSIDRPNWDKVTYRRPSFIRQS